MADFQNQKERLKRFISEMNLTNAAFEKSLGLSNGYINSMRKGLGYDKLEQLSNTYTNLNIGWLLTGEGEMFYNENNEDSKKTVIDSSIRQRVAHLLKYKNISIDFVSKETGISQAILNKQINGELAISAKTIIILLKYYSDVSAEWLIRGDGEIEKGINSNSSLVANSNGQKLLIEFNKQTELLLKEKDDTIRDLQLKLALYKAKENIRDVG